MKEYLKYLRWVEGECYSIPIGSYRHSFAVVCSRRATHSAEFQNGLFPYFAYIELLAGGVWVREGTTIVPVLPDGRFVMVINQRPAQARFKHAQHVLQLARTTLDLSSFGPYSSLEFPGGAIEPGENITLGFLRELSEETGIVDENAILYRRCRPCFPSLADIALQGYYGVVFLSRFSFNEHVESDGGLRVLALTRDEVVRNIRNGVIACSQSALLSWSFYREVEEARSDKRLGDELVSAGYLSIDRVCIRTTLS